MKAAIFKETGRFAIEEVTTPVPGPGEILCRVSYCGICGTDLHNYSFGITSPGSQLGHEWCGTVAKLGDGVKNFSLGERVMPYKHPGAPLPFPRLNGRMVYSALNRRGAYAEYTVAAATGLIRIPDEISDQAAACTEPLVAGIHAVRLGNIKLSDTVAFIGAGPIALFMIQRVRQAGARAVYVSEISQVRAKKAAELGADRVFNPLKENFVAEVVNLTGRRGPDIVYECAAARNTLNQACQLVARNGRIVCLAVYQEPITLEPLEWYMMQPEIKFTTNGDSTPFDWEIAVELLRKKQIDVETTISDIVPLTNIQETFQVLINPAINTMLRVLIKP